MDRLNRASPLDLLPLLINQSYSADVDERAGAIKDLHEQVRRQIKKQNQKYSKQANKHGKAMIFKEGHLVWVLYLSKERFSPGRNSKLKRYSDEPIRIVRCMGDNHTMWSC